MGLTTLGDRNALSYKDNDIDSDGDGKVDAAVDTDEVGGIAPSDGATGAVLQTSGSAWQLGTVDAGTTALEYDFVMGDF
jgi:hypothetical protein